MNQYFDRYIDISKEMVGVYIYVEGNNSLFYKHLKEFTATTLYNEMNTNDIIGGHSSSAIRKKVAEDRAKGLQAFGIVDKDYNSTFDNYIYPIDFYCIENIALLKMNDLSPLKQTIENLIDLNLNEFKFRKFDLVITRGEDMRVSYYSIDTPESVHNDFFPYLQANVQCKETFLKYKDLKSLVIKYSDFHKQKHGKKFEIKYLENLIDYIEDRSIATILTVQTYERFIRDTSLT